MMTLQELKQRFGIKEEDLEPEVIAFLKARERHIQFMRGEKTSIEIHSEQLIEQEEHKQKEQEGQQDKM